MKAKNKKIIKEAQSLINGLTSGIEGITVFNLSDLHHIAYGKLAGAVLFFDEDSPYMINFIQNYSEELNGAIQEALYKKQQENNKED